MTELSSADSPLRLTPLYDLYLSLGARMTPFAGYQLPIQYKDGIIAEHLATRTGAGLFDVSHMGQVLIEGEGACEKFERLVPADIRRMEPGRTRYTQFLNADGGVLDDLMVTRLEGAREKLLVVCNGAVKRQDLALMKDGLPDLRVEMFEDRALLALQGPSAAKTLQSIVLGVEKLKFMSMARFDFEGSEIIVWRSGYTGEDGFELSIPASCAIDLAKKILVCESVKPVGLGARDSLRLEAGLCLYGHDLTVDVNPIEADLLWSIPRARRENGVFVGAERLRRVLREGPSRKRVGLILEGRAIARENAQILTLTGADVGIVTSGAFSPSLGRPIAMGYVAREFLERTDASDLTVHVVIRGKPALAKITALPFIPNRYFRG